jgi:CMP-N-acetylneuraminic acid synthetase
MNVLGIIPARGGSKGVHKKNIKPINGIPLIHYSIIRGIESKLITHLYLSTDSDEIISNCSSFPQLKIHKRPSEFA